MKVLHWWHKWRSWEEKESSNYVLTSFLLLRVLGFVYFFAFLSLATQVIPLVGENGLLPAKNFLAFYDSRFSNEFWNLPTIFWLHLSDTALLYVAWFGVLLSVVVLVGFANMPIMFLLWLLYLSYVNIAQIWLSYGWEIMLLETGFLAIFLCPLWDPKPFAKPSVLAIWLFRWLAFRIFLGAGLIKLRADECWRNLTCLYYHYETQPIPNPLSRLFHFAPLWFHKFALLWNHFIELVVPFFVFYPRMLRIAAGILLISFQLILMASGNFSFLNWLAIVPCIACFDDQFLRKCFPLKIMQKVEHLHQKKECHYAHIVSILLIIVVVWLSIPVVANMLSSQQIMNTSFNNFHLVNTYGMFGSIGKERYELILEGTTDTTLTENTQWTEYEFKAKPGDISKNSPFIAPYQPRIDWQIWFAAMQTPEQNPWLIHLIWKLLHNDESALTLLKTNPFPDTPPTFIRVLYYRYEFAGVGNQEGKIWERELRGQWLPPLSKNTKELQNYISAHGWGT
jgi:hypothetical protein